MIENQGNEDAQHREGEMLRGTSADDACTRDTKTPPAADKL